MAKSPVTILTPPDWLANILRSLADPIAWGFLTKLIGEPVEPGIAEQIKRLATLVGSPGGTAITGVEYGMALDIGHNFISWAPWAKEEMNRLPVFSWMQFDDRFCDALRVSGALLIEWAGGGWSLVHYEGAMVKMYGENWRTAPENPMTYVHGAPPAEPPAPVEG